MFDFVLKNNQVGVGVAPLGGLRIRAYFVNVDGSEAREACMADQLAHVQTHAAKLGAFIDFARFPAVTFKTCNDTESCKRERPECFPEGRSAYIDHGADGQGDREAFARVVRGVLANACSHLKVLSRMLEEEGAYDYFMLFEDDTIFKPNFVSVLVSFLRSFPNFWNLVALDTFAGQAAKILPSNDHFFTFPDGSQLYSISATRDTYWGAHAWLLSGQHLGRFAEHYQSSPSLPVDWFPKVPHSRHMGMWSLQSGALSQRDVVTKDDASLLIPSCRSIAGSDLVMGAGNNKLQEGNHTLVTSLMRKPSIKQELVRVPQELAVLGMTHAAVPMLRHLVHEHLEVAFNVSLCRNICASLPAWTSPENILQRGDLNGVVGVVVVRHPFSLVEDAREAPANAEEYAARAQNWNEMISSYLALKQRFHRLRVLRYEDLLENPSFVLAQLAQELGLPKPSAGRQQSLASIPTQLRRDSVRNMTCADVAGLCRTLDRTLLYGFGYHGCQDRWLGQSKLIFDAEELQAVLHPLKGLRTLPVKMECPEDLLHS